MERTDGRSRSWICLPQGNPPAVHSRYKHRSSALPGGPLGGLPSVSDQWPLKAPGSTLGGGIAKPLVSPLTPVPPLHPLAYWHSICCGVWTGRTHRLIHGEHGSNNWKRHRLIHWCCWICKSRSQVVVTATTVVGKASSQWVHEWRAVDRQRIYHLQSSRSNVTGIGLYFNWFFEQNLESGPCPITVKISVITATNLARISVQDLQHKTHTARILCVHCSTVQRAWLVQAVINMV